MVQTLVDVPGLVTVNAAEGRHTVVLEVRMAPTDVGKVIGKQGGIAGALRTILSAAAGKQGKRALIEIEEPPGKRQIWGPRTKSAVCRHFAYKALIYFAKPYPFLIVSQRMFWRQATTFVTVTQGFEGLRGY